MLTIPALDFWLAVAAQTLIATVASVRYIIRIERRLMAIELQIGLRYNNGKGWQS